MGLDVPAVSRGLSRLRICAGLTAIAATLTLAACGSDDSSSSSSASASGSSSASSGDRPAWCGDKQVTLGIQDGGGLNAWSAASLAQVKREAKLCPSIKKQIVVNAGFDPQKATSGLQSMIAQGAKAITIIPDAGVCAELPTLRQATQRGITVATWGANGCGKVGKDYDSYTDEDGTATAKTMTTWLVKAMGGKGNVLFLGGPAGNLVDQSYIPGIKAVLAQNPGVKLLGNVSEKSWPVTNWDPAEAQKVTAGLLAKYPQVDAIFDGYGAEVQGDLKAFRDAGRRIPPIVTTQLNSLSCDYQKAKGTKDAYELATISNRNWMGRFAVRKAIAGATGGKDTAKSIVPLPLLEDSTQSGSEPKCYQGKDPDYDPSNESTDAQLEELMGR